MERFKQGCTSVFVVFFFLRKNIYFVYLATLGLGCRRQDL